MKYAKGKDTEFQPHKALTILEHGCDDGAPIIVDADGDGKMEVVFTECYSDVYCADAKTGAIKWSATLKNPDGGIEGLFSPVGWYPDAGCVIVATAWWKQNEGVYCLSGKNGSKKWRFNKGKLNITSGAVIGDVDGNPGAEVVFGTEAGEIVALDKTGRLVIEHKVGGPVECTPTLADIDGNGNPESGTDTPQAERCLTVPRIHPAGICAE